MRLAVLASGSGTILDAICAADVPVSVVIVDRECGAQEVAARNGLSCEIVKRHSYGKDFDRDGFTAALLGVLSGWDIELVAMAGFGTILGKGMFGTFPGHILNTHPSLLPSFPGWHGVEDALAYGVKVTGCTVHIATEEVDAGPILAQEALAIEAEDTAATLHERIKAVERRIYVRTISDIIERGSVQ
ncbi:MAG: phosphoribosylglycinamide formyltransferase [Acidimicrobiales bacterium]